MKRDANDAVYPAIDSEPLQAPDSDLTQGERPRTPARSPHALWFWAVSDDAQLPDENAWR